MHIKGIQSAVKMAARQDSGEAEDVMFLTDLFLAQEKAKQEKAKRTSEGSRFHIRWVEKDDERHPLQKRSRSGQTRKRISASEAASKDLNRFEMTEEVPVLSESSTSQCLIVRPVRLCSCDSAHLSKAAGKAIILVYINGILTLTEEGQCGLLCHLQERLADVEQKIKIVSSRYSMALGPNALLLPEDGPEETPEEEHNMLPFDTLDDSDLEDI
ncbi:uncharacterized protein LOC118801253 isoform X2 [Colossoma macropomum]|uniref:uncharacterized protein LOC118801253 isoform X2 n=1 Tax=Colossoma macropomum TaxID=42526 RepID=UPI001863CD04|nr:uncharacterized protein LOC118801253 isoform X2 [Colossoma macropomum]